MNEKPEGGLGAAGDSFYAALMAAHEGLNDANSQALNARLVLLMANEIGSLERLLRLLETARGYADRQNGT